MDRSEFDDARRGGDIIALCHANASCRLFRRFVAGVACAVEGARCGETRRHRSGTGQHPW